MASQSVNEATLTIPITTALSSALNVNGLIPRAIYVPALWTAADIGFNLSVDGSTWVPARTATGTLIRITNIQTAAAAWYQIDPNWPICAAASLKLTSVNTASEAAVNQAAERILKIRWLPR